MHSYERENLFSVEIYELNLKGGNLNLLSKFYERKTRNKFRIKDKWDVNKKNIPELFSIGILVMSCFGVSI